MKHTCPCCGNTHDVSIDTVLMWIVSSRKLRTAVARRIGQINGRKVDPKKQSRGSEGGRKAANARWEKYRAEKAKAEASAEG